MNKIKPLVSALVIATYGTGALAQAYLEEVVAKTFFPELLTVRTAL